MNKRASEAAPITSGLRLPDEIAQAWNIVAENIGWVLNQSRGRTLPELQSLQQAAGLLAQWIQARARAGQGPPVEPASAEPPTEAVPAKPED